MNRILAIVGPTAVGKSDLALHIAQALGGEIVVADSRQVYRFMDIGTAKATGDERALVPHHLIDVVNPNEDFSLAIYQKMADEALKDIQRRGKLGILGGGTGLYVWAVLQGFRIPAVPPNPELRSRLEARAAAEGPEALYQELSAKDPVAAAKIDLRNVRRVIRALEVREISGAPASGGQRRQARWEAVTVGLTTDRDDLYQRIDARVERMIEQGLVEEVRRLMQMGYSLELPAFSSPGYREIGQHLIHELSLPTAIERIKTHTHRLARHQYAWFRLGDKRIQWFDVRAGIEKIGREVMEILAPTRDVA